MRVELRSGGWGCAGSAESAESAKVRHGLMCVVECVDNAENAGKCRRIFANPAKNGGNIDICWRDCWLEWFRGLYLQSTCRRAGRLR